METQIKAFYKTPQGIKFITVFGYSTKGVPTLEINGLGKLSKNIKEKIIYLSRIRKLQIPMRRFVICIDQNELSEKDINDLKWLEFPLLLLYWYLAGLIPIRKLDNCITSGWVNLRGDIFQMSNSLIISEQVLKLYHPSQRNYINLISSEKSQDFNGIESEKLLANIPKLRFYIDYKISPYMDKDSAIPTNFFIA